VALSESPLDAKLLWAGTDDGNVRLTRDGGASWTDVTAKLPTPKGTYVSRIEASHHAAGTAFVSLDGHRTGDNEPHVLETRDHGATWRSIAADLPAGGPVRVVREDLANPDLLFAGTEFGAFVSLDRGAHWLPLRPKGFPAVQVHDIQIHPRDRDVVIGTHGRSVWVMDDITGLEQLTAEVRAKPLALLAPRPARGSYLLERGGMWGDDQYAVKNPPYGATLNYWLAARETDGATVTIQGAGGAKLREIKGSGEAGLNRVTWDLKVEDEQRHDPSEAEMYGQFPLVPAGVYDVVVKAGKNTSAGKLTVSYPEGVGPQPVTQAGP